VSIDGSTWDVWEGIGGSTVHWFVVSYVQVNPTNSVNLDLTKFFQDAKNRGYVQPSWWLIDVEFGFEVWDGGQGLAVDDFAVSAK
jgi:Glycosyl hydrolase family 12